MVTVPHQHVLVSYTHCTYHASCTGGQMHTRQQSHVMAECTQCSLLLLILVAKSIYALALLQLEQNIT